MPTVHVATACDPNMEIGLHAMLYTLLDHLDVSYDAVLHLFLKDFSEARLRRLDTTLEPFKGRYARKVYDVTTLDLGVGKGIGLNKMTYAILSMPNVVEADWVFCVDADMLVLTDLAPVRQQAEASNALALVVCKRVASDAHPFEADLYRKYGLQDETPVFNAGLVVANCKRYGAEEIQQKSLDLIARHPAMTDQTALNILLHDRLEKIDAKYNQVYTSRAPMGGSPDLVPGTTTDLVVHFLGIPKPWEFLAKSRHRYFRFFEPYLRQTVFKRHSTLTAFTKCTPKRLSFIVRSYLKG